MEALIVFVAAALVAIALNLLINIITFPRLRPAVPAVFPRVSVLIPARDEAASIIETLSRLDAQVYPALEILVLDDNSTDATAELALSVGGRIRVLNGAPLPSGWSGKNWACHQLALQATGEILLFTDADVSWEPGAVGTLVAEMLRTRADLLTVWPTQITVTWAERLIVPLMSLVVMGYLPVLGVHYIPLMMFGAANGQCMAWRRDVYERSGGHEAVRDNVLEDVTLARRVKHFGLRLRMADGTGFIVCRMYSDWPSVRRGYAKNILAGYGGILPLAFATLFHWLIFILPWLWLIDSTRLLLYGAHVSAVVIPLILVALGIIVRALSAAFTRQRVVDALLLPVSVLLMTIVAMQSIFWQIRFGGPQWKGRIVSPRPLWYRGVGGKG